MAHLVTRVAPVLLASLVATVASVSTHAETAAAPDCLAKPSGPAAKGNHWYYRVDRPSGRHCWYQRPIDAAKHAPAVPQPHPSAAVVAPPATPPPADAPAATPPASNTSSVAAAADTGAGALPPVAAPAAPPAPPWPAVAPPPAAAPVAEQAPAPKMEEQQPDPIAIPPVNIPVRTLKVERPAEPAGVASHTPALLGAALALTIIVIGLLATWLVPKLRQRRTTRPVRDRESSITPLQDAPGIVPSMTERDEPDRRAVRAEPRRPGRAPSPETARALEENVRDLLHRLQADLRARPTDAPDPAAHAPSTHELDAVLAQWRAKRR